MQKIFPQSTINAPAKRAFFWHTQLWTHYEYSDIEQAKGLHMKQ